MRVFYDRQFKITRILTTLTGGLFRWRSVSSGESLPFSPEQALPEGAIAFREGTIACSIDFHLKSRSLNFSSEYAIAGKGRSHLGKGDAAMREVLTKTIA